MSDTELRVSQIQSEARDVVAHKNERYGSSWRHQGWRGNLSRVLEKSDRLRAMLWRGGTPLLNGEREHPRETLLDIMNTCAFMIANMDDGVEWGNEPQAKDILPFMYQDDRPHSQIISPPQEWSEATHYQPGPEATQAHPVVGELGVPGEERMKEDEIAQANQPQKPSPGPRKRGGSGPRQIVDRPQA